MTTTRKSAIVTGASRGIGAAVAKRLAQNGFFVGVGCRERQDLAEAVLSEIRAKGGDGIVLRLDISDAESVKKAFDEFAGVAGGIDVLVANAGMTYSNMAALTPDETVSRVMDVNVAGTFRCVKAAAKQMIRRKTEGRMILMGSVVGLSGNAGQSVYAASKAALVGMAKSLAKELAPRHILVNVIAPGLIETGEGGMTDTMTEEMRATILKMTPVGRAGTPEDVASVASFLATGETGFITGQVFLVDGGLRM